MLYLQNKKQNVLTEKELKDWDNMSCLFGIISQILLVLPI